MNPGHFAGFGEPVQTATFPSRPQGRTHRKPQASACEVGLLAPCCFALYDYFAIQAFFCSLR
jgi:hypothetical protein